MSTQPTTTRTLPFVLVQPVAGWRPEVRGECVVSWRNVKWPLLLAELGRATAVALDWETRGTSTWLPETAAVGLAVAWTTAPSADWADDTAWGPTQVDWIYIDLSDGDDMGIRWACRLWEFVALRRRDTGCVVVAHNAMFDEAIARMHARRLGLNWDWDGNGLASTHCTYVLYKMLASEGWTGQEWGLKAAMRDVLGWEDTNELGRDEWLLSHGYHSTGPTRGGHGVSPEAHLASIRAWESILKKSGAPRDPVAPELGEMWRVPAHILGAYSALDAIAALQLYARVLHPLCTQFPELANYHSDRYLHLLSCLIDQQYHGVRVDRDALAGHGAALATRAAEADAVVRAHPTVRDYIAAVRERELAAVRGVEPPRWRKPKPVGVEPPRLTAKGVESKNWLRWLARSAEAPTQSKVWEAWSARVAEAEQGTEHQLNLASGADLSLLVYGDPELQWDGLIQWLDGEPANPDRHSPGTVWLDGRFGDVEMERTDSGALPVDGDVLAQLRDPILREALAAHHDAVKERQFVTAWLGLLHDHGPDGGWRLHAGWRPYGALTGRLSGEKPSLHQAPKSHDLLAPLVADPGWVLFEKDWNSLEPHILAELSRDPGLMDLYGPDANPNHDRYLYSACSFPDPVGARVRQWYDRANPTAESVAVAKKECKRERTNAKSPVLALDYGAGAKKIYRTMRSQGAEVTPEEVVAMVDALKEVHRGIYKEYQPRLAREWAARGGWVLTGLGFPNPVHEKKLKDLINRVVQRTGHDCHVLYVSELTHRMRCERIPYRDVVCDFHDQIIRAVPAEWGPRTLELDAEVTEYVSDVLQLTVRLKGPPKLSHNMAEAKEVTT